MKNRWLLVSLVISLAIIVCVPNQAAAAPVPSYSLIPSTLSIQAGSEFTVKVEGSNIVDLYGYEVNLAYDSTRLQLQETKDKIGGFAIDPIVTQNRIQYAGTKIGLVQGDNGSLTLSEFKFKAIASGAASISLTSVKAINSQLLSTVQSPTAGVSIQISSHSAVSGSKGAAGNGNGLTPVTIIDQIAVAKVDSNQKFASILNSEIGGLPLKVQTPLLTINVKPEVIQALRNQLGNVKDALLKVEFLPIVDETGIAEMMLQQRHAKVKVVGQPYDISLVLVAPDGRKAVAEQVGSGVELVFTYLDKEIDGELLGVYYFNEAASSWEYVGGTLDAQTDRVAVSLDHLSKYVLLEYNKTFKDIPAAHWASRTLQIMAARHIVNGVTDDEFKPNASTTRAEFTSLLVRALGMKSQGSAVASSAFADVAAGAWYANDVEMAYEAGLINGISDGRFVPNAKITREQMAALIIRAFEWKTKQSIQSVNELEGYRDAEEVSRWSAKEVEMAIAAGLMRGKSGDVFDPKSNSLRVEAAQVMMNLLNQISILEGL
ncbi:S-layer homology domain-containing protein [Paenibacillus sinopodophylli]|uniref:S-layer homology domain-containing protein n=1 Tax=Paenibacillus sinopodophylli TaxID=1837342 RepID=UPI001486A904|nr:S-layer homology domain-containing protein [Paenibacillus sinopodophylli]